MDNFNFPFPGKSLALKELSYDPCYSKIPQNDKQLVVDIAWDCGTNAANDIFKEYKKEADFFNITKKSGLKCIKHNKDYVVGNSRYFSDYISGQNIINLYLGSIELWAKENNLSVQTAENLILCHEYYHFLECNKIGLTSRLYTVPIIEVFNIKIGKTGIRAMSEIGAHGFVYEYMRLIKEMGLNNG